MACWNSPISLEYPASITTNCPLRFSASCMMVSMASCPTESFSFVFSEYASSIKSTPPIALSKYLVTIFGVSPTYCEMRSALDTSTNCPVGRAPSAFSASAKRRAIVVLPVPGFPRNMKWSVSVTFASGPFARRASCSEFAMERRQFFISSTPTNLSKSAMTSSNVLGMNSFPSTMSAPMMAFAMLLPTYFICMS